jgi:hypothetical protein
MTLLRGFAEAVSDAVHEGISCAVLATGIHGCGKVGPNR